MWTTTSTPPRKARGESAPRLARMVNNLPVKTLVHKDLSAPIGQFGKGDRINTAAGNLNAALSKYKPESEQLV